MRAIARGKESDYDRVVFDRFLREEIRKNEASKENIEARVGRLNKPPAAIQKRQERSVSSENPRPNKKSRKAPTVIEALNPELLI